MEGILAIALVVSLFLLAVCVAAAVVLAKIYLTLRRKIPDIRQDAVERSHAVTRGKVTEQLIPYLPDFPYDPKDARFIGSPIDFLVFDGLSEGDVRSVVFVEVKTGGSGLSTRERRVRDAILERNVEWRELRTSARREEVS